MFNTFKERLQFIIDNLANGRQVEFAKKIDVPSNTLNNYLKKGVVPKIDFIQKLKTAYPEINSDWLLMNNGQPLLHHADIPDMEEILTKNGISTLLFQKDNLIAEKDARIKELEKRIDDLKEFNEYLKKTVSEKGAS